MCAYAGVDYLTACVFTYENHERIGPLFYFELPTMHQTLELLSKAVALMEDNTFNPQKYNHHVKKIMKDYAGQILNFKSILSYPHTLLLLDGLEKSYLEVRYGECSLSYDGDAWLLFRRIADNLLDDIRSRTDLPFRYGKLSPVMPTE